ncbi:hypothetical protein F5I97DRAFT_934626 [Phlebopus sp. FC_14]|nr:hypothetical protein F5I97DRAFT_934626 [Phlebopus sp. FC_14]
MDDLVASVGNAINDMGIIRANDVPPPTVVEPPRHHEDRDGRQGLEIRREEKRFSVSPERSRWGPFASPPSSDESAAHSWVDPDKTLTFTEENLPPLPAKNDATHVDRKSLKNALNIKRFSSLPRTPSLASLSPLSTGSKRSSRTPSPSISHVVTKPRPHIQRIRSACPSAMYFADVIVKRSPLERSIGYAHKINELYSHDCGLGDWVLETRYKVAHPQSSVKRATVNSSGPRAPSTSSPSIAPRHISQSSTDSGVTFPRRADAYSATDLSARNAEDDSSPNAPPPLPYPGLATAPRSGPSRASTMIASSSSSSARSMVSPPSSKSTGAFFATLGRKTSIKKEKGGSQTPTSPAKVLTKSPHKTESNPRPANIPPVAPSVPGGPRAPPYRVQRSQTIAPQTPPNAGSTQRSSMTVRRPSLFSSRGSAPDQQSSLSEADFNRQVDKLAALLPKADRNVLAFYLRRAGQDILAIGQYLEDEKNGTLRRE